MNNYKDNIKDLMSLSGALCAAVVDYDSGMTLGLCGGRHRS